MQADLRHARPRAQLGEARYREIFGERAPECTILRQGECRLAKRLEPEPTGPWRRGHLDDQTAAADPAAVASVQSYLDALYAPMMRGSNNWVVTGSATAGGNPMLASDPHVVITTPALLHEAHVHAGALNASGIGLPSLPLLLFGHNMQMAWGSTSGLTNSTDVRRKVPAVRAARSMTTASGTVLTT